MGVSGSGKTTVGRMVADRLHATFVDGDDFHPDANIAKMSRNEALTDDDRRPWLDAIAGRMAVAVDRGEDLVVACSALRRAYRERLRIHPDVRFVYLKGSPEQVGDRLRSRVGHFMPASLLRSQFDTLEEPDDALTLDIDAPAEAIARRIVSEVGRE